MVKNLLITALLYVPFVACGQNLCLDFDGVNDRVVSELVENVSGDFTVELWCNGPPINSTGSYPRLAAFDFSFALARYTDKLAFYRGSGAWIETDAVICDNTWHHVALVRSNTTYIAYVDGVQVHTTTGASTSFDKNFTVGFKGATGSLNELWIGQIDEVRYWDDARTAQEIASNMTTELQGDEEGLAVYYKFNEGVPAGDNSQLQDVLDHNDPSNNGNLLGFSLMGLQSNFVESTVPLAAPEVFVDAKLRVSDVDTLVRDSVSMLGITADGLVGVISSAGNGPQQLSVSTSGDTLYLTDGGYIIIPGISAANYILDGDGNVYTSVDINGYNWLQQNLQTTSYNDGSPISEVQDSIAWYSQTAPAYCWFENDQPTYGQYGALYNWYVTNPAANGGKNVCPVGFHIPTLGEINDFVNSAPQSVTALTLKEEGTVFWNNNTGTNETNFSALGSGVRYTSENGDFENLKEATAYWTTSSQNSILLTDNATQLINWLVLNTMGISIRCLGD